MHMAARKMFDEKPLAKVPLAIYLNVKNRQPIYIYIYMLQGFLHHNASYCIMMRIMVLIVLPCPPPKMGDDGPSMIDENQPSNCFLPRPFPASLSNAWPLHWLRTVIPMDVPTLAVQAGGIWEPSGPSGPPLTRHGAPSETCAQRWDPIPLEDIQCTAP